MVLWESSTTRGGGGYFFSSTFVLFVCGMDSRSNNDNSMGEKKRDK